MDFNDVTVFVNAYGNDIGVTGRGVLSRWHSRKGYAGYEWDPGLERASRGVTVGGGDDPTVTLPPRSMWHVRHRSTRASGPTPVSRSCLISTLRSRSMTTRVDASPLQKRTP